MDWIGGLGFFPSKLCSKLSNLIVHTEFPYWINSVRSSRQGQVRCDLIGTENDMVISVNCKEVVPYQMSVIPGIPTPYRDDRKNMLHPILRLDILPKYIYVTNGTVGRIGFCTRMAR